MNTYGYCPGMHDPEHLAALTEIGLDTRSEEDRLLALEAANHFDVSHGTSYGREVLEIFMDQQELGFENDTRPSKDVTPRHDIHSAETPRVGRIMNAVFKAVGSDIGVEIKLLEYVGDDAEGVPLVADPEKRELLPYRLATVRLDDDFRFLLDVWPERPYAIRQKHWRDKSLRNFSIAMDAIMHTNVSQMAAAGRAG